MPTAAHPAQTDSHSHPHAGGPARGKSKLYNPRHPERTLLYQTIDEHLETWHALASAGQFDGQGDHHTPKSFVRQAFRKYLECGIFTHGFGSTWCCVFSRTTDRKFNRMKRNMAWVGHT